MICQEVKMHLYPRLGMKKSLKTENQLWRLVKQLFLTGRRQRQE